MDSCSLEFTFPLFVPCGMYGGASPETEQPVVNRAEAASTSWFSERHSARNNMRNKGLVAICLLTYFVLLCFVTQ